PVIALSIAVTALLNLRPVHWVRTDVLALVFGLVHGFGFAGLLQEAAAPEGLLLWALAGFNLGVEAGQLMAVTLWVLVSQLVVRKRWYHRVVVRGGSVLLVLLAAWWFWERVS
ncbi:MAG: HupE/UreJ family protein, partial [Polaromonas sp.]|nr:HupE/UreJ family protein [Polaromonas sp.]